MFYFNNLISYPGMQRPRPETNSLADIPTHDAALPAEAADAREHPRGGGQRGRSPTGREASTHHAGVRPTAHHAGQDRPTHPRLPLVSAGTHRDRKEMTPEQGAVCKQRQVP